METKANDLPPPGCFPKMNKVQFGRFKASYRRKGAEWMLLAGLCGIGLFGGYEMMFATSVTGTDGSVLEPAFTPTGVRRRQLLEDVTGEDINSTNSTECVQDTAGLTMYPLDAFGLPNCGPKGSLVLHSIGILYMFVALAVVCDEFFVPALEVMIDKWKMSNDVAGATLMAAGGSAPELFTSIISTFIAEDGDATGFGTIIGSAVFNVLFVIGVCACVSPTVLSLTWWPLARDSVYYIWGLVMLGIFFATISPGEIEWFESMILLLMYIGYVLIMVVNQRLKRCLERCCGGIKRMSMKRSSKVNAVEEGTAGDAEPDTTTLDVPPRPGVKNSKKSVVHSTTPEAIAHREKMKEKEGHGEFNLNRPTTFRAGLTHFMVKDNSMANVAAIHMIDEILGNVRETFDKIDTDHNNSISTDELAQLLKEVGGGVECKPDEVEAMMKEMDEDNDGTIEFDEFQAFYMSSRKRYEHEFLRLLADHGIKDTVDKTQLTEVFTRLEEEVGLEFDIVRVQEELGITEDNTITAKALVEFYVNDDNLHTSWRKNASGLEKEAKAEAEGMSLAWPEGARQRVTYIILAPIMYTLAYTVPNCRNPKWQKWFMVSFVVSIIWIAAYSYLMVWWATVFGIVTGIPSNVMGLTILAAGTSVPDLLSSVVVSKRGNGDMAVSSSIGSNIFDILFGLPFPWFLRSMIPKGGLTEGINGEGEAEMVAYAWPLPVSISSDGAWIDIGILIGMVAITVGLIAAFGWKMSKPFGYAMFVAYVAFLVQAFVREFG